MKINKVLLTGFFLLGACIDKKSKSRLFTVTPVDTGLYRESYLVSSGGAHSAELYSHYLTDSTTFRAYIGTVDEHEAFGYEVEGDTVKVTKVNHDRTYPVILEEKRYSKSSWRRERKFG